MNKCKNQNGITLIALVITIIVMLILVAVTITMAVNGGLFDYARKAGQETNEAIEDEQKLAEGSIMDAYLYGTTEAVISLPAYTESLLDEDTGVLTANTKYINGGKAAVIPKGFKLSDLPQEQTIENGLVIEDEEQNQFVWVPVTKGTFERNAWWNNEPTTKTLDEITENFTLDDYKKYIAQNFGYETIEELLENYYGYDEKFETYEELLEYARGEVETEEELEQYTIEWFKEKCECDRYWDAEELGEYYIENIENDPTDEYENMVNSVNTYGGFYIGRYEAGSNDNRKTTRTDETVLVQKGAFPYNHVAWAKDMTNYEEIYADGSKNYGHGAVYLSKNMYADEEVYGVKSTLCYGVQWDATLKFIKDKVNVTSSAGWGNFYTSIFTFSGEYSEDNGATWKSDKTTKPGKSNWLLKTGASEQNKVKNIYDLAGNICELTMEIYNEECFVARGADYSNTDMTFGAACRPTFAPGDVDYRIGFRPTLYITNQ